MAQFEVIVGSQMGSAEYVADQLIDVLADHGHSAALHLEPDLTKLDVSSPWLVITSTYGAGDYPDNILDFVQQINEADALTMPFYMVGVGDSSYDTYNLAAKNLASVLQSKGAKVLQAPLLIDVLDDALPEDTACAWFVDQIKDLSL